MHGQNFILKICS